MVEMNNYKYKISIIVLNYKKDKNLSLCLESLINQTVDDFEIRIIDTGYSEGSTNICLKYAREYDNITLIKIEEGKFEAYVNREIKNAKGEYVILIDNNSVVPYDAYEKLYEKIQKEDADICMGSVNILTGKNQRESPDYERNVWEKERIIKDLHDFPLIFHDAFYGNKIIKKEMLIENNIKASNIDYSSRRFVHESYVNAKTIVIIPDCVCIQKNIAEGNRITDIEKQSEDYINLITSYESDLNYFKEYNNDYIYILIVEMLKPIKKIIMNIEEVHDAFFSIGHDFLKKNLKLEDLYNENLKIIDKLLVYCILNKISINKVLKIKLGKENEILDKNNKNYWKLPLFNSFEDFPEELFEIQSLEPQFLKIKSIMVENDFIIFDEIKLPEYLPVEKTEVEFCPITRYDDILKDNTLSFEVNCLNENNLFNLKIPNEKLEPYEIYDVYLKAYLKNGTSNKIRISEKRIDSVYNRNKYLQVFSTNNKNLSVFKNYLDGKFEIECTDDELKVIVKNPEDLKKSLKIFLRDAITKDKFYLNSNGDKTVYSLKWKFFLEKNSIYNFYFTFFNESKEITTNVKLNIKYLNNFKKIKFKNNDINVEIYKTKYDNVRLRSIN